MLKVRFGPFPSTAFSTGIADPRGIDPGSLGARLADYSSYCLAEALSLSS